MTDEDTQVTGTIADLIVQMLKEETGEESVQEYLKSGFLSSAVDTLFYARKQAGLTQAQVAEQLNTKQAAIARLEADTEGSMSLRRYVEAALACGMVPLDITLVPVSALRDYVIAHPEAPRTQEAYNEWVKTMAQEQAGVHAGQPESDAPSVTDTTTPTSLDTDPDAELTARHREKPVQLVRDGNRSHLPSDQQTRDQDEI